MSCENCPFRDHVEEEIAQLEESIAYHRQIIAENLLHDALNEAEATIASEMIDNQARFEPSEVRVLISKQHQYITKTTKRKSKDFKRKNRGREAIVRHRESQILKKNKYIESALLRCEDDGPKTEKKLKLFGKEVLKCQGTSRLDYLK